jgi:hypothetical protein
VSGLSPDGLLRPLRGGHQPCSRAVQELFERTTLGSYGSDARATTAPHAGADLVATPNLIPRPVLEEARRGVARLVLQTMLLVEVRCQDPAERWRVAKKMVGMMVRGEL